MYIYPKPSNMYNIKLPIYVNGRKSKLDMIRLYVYKAKLSLITTECFRFFSCIRISNKQKFEIVM